MNENTDFFIDLFILFALKDGRTEYQCNRCQCVVVTDQPPSRAVIQTIQQMMRGFYCRSLVFDNVPWVICEHCHEIMCPECAFHIIYDSLQDGMLTSFCPQCNEDYSYEEVINLTEQGEVIIFDIDDEDAEMDMEEYEQIITTGDNAIDQECPICLNVKARTDRLDCGHGFCRDCLFKALQIQRKCPMCRGEV